ncbi:MAG: aminoacyl-tRNA hydrolase [Clostridium sp.]
MYLVVGLGNPGNEYRNTRHNIGFEAVDTLAYMYKTSIERAKFKGIYGESRIESEKVIFLKPTTYMNLSGECVIQFAKYYNIPNENIIILYDDISLEIGKMRIREKGSAGGHNGIKSLIACLSTEVFTRVKIGVGKPEHDLVSHVLGKINDEDMPRLKQVLEATVQAVAIIIKEDVKTAMNKYNGFMAE